MKVIEYLPNKENIRTNESKSELHPFISDGNEQYACDSHTHTVHLFKKFIELEHLVYGFSDVWKYTEGFAKQYRCALAIYFTILSSYLYGIIMDREINAPGNG